MKSLYINNDGDIEFDELNKFKVISGNSEVAQRNKIAISINQGEWIFDILLGIPWVEMMSDKTTTMADYEREIKQILESDEAIKKVEKINTEYTSGTRHLKIDFIAKLVDGTRIEEEVEV